MRTPLGQKFVTEREFQAVQRQGWNNLRLLPQASFHDLVKNWLGCQQNQLFKQLADCCSGPIDALKHWFSWTAGGNPLYPADPRL